MLTRSSTGLDIISPLAAAPAPRARARVTSSAAVSASANDPLLYHHISVVSVQEHCQHSCNEEENNVHDAERPARLEHGAILVDISSPWRVAVASKVAERPQ